MQEPSFITLAALAPSTDGSVDGDRFGAGETTLEALMKSGPDTLGGMQSVIFPDGTSLSAEEVDFFLLILTDLTAVSPDQRWGDHSAEPEADGALLAIPDDVTDLSLEQIMQIKAAAGAQAQDGEEAPVADQDFSELSLAQLMRLSVIRSVDEGEISSEALANLFTLSLGELLQLKLRPSFDEDEPSPPTVDLAALSLEQLMAVAVDTAPDETAQSPTDLVGLSLAQLLAVPVSVAQLDPDLLSARGANIAALARENDASDVARFDIPPGESFADLFVEAFAADGAAFVASAADEPTAQTSPPSPSPPSPPPAAANTAPTANADADATAQAISVTVSVLGNDTDPDVGDTLSVVVVTQGANGSVVINVDGTITYTPDAGFAGNDAFTYTISDGNGGNSTAQVTVAVTPAGCTIMGTAGADVLNGTNSQDVMCGMAGNDVMNGDNGQDILRGGDGNDVLNGENGADALYGDAGDDQLDGGNGSDFLDGGSGADILIGGNGSDVFVWDSADISIDGGSGPDTLRLDGSDADMTTFGGTATGIERVDMEADGGANTLTLDIQDVLDLSDTDVLTVIGDGLDVLDAGTGWTDGGFDTNGDQIYTQTNGSGTATLLVDTDITVNADILL